MTNFRHEKRPKTDNLFYETMTKLKSIWKIIYNYIFSLLTFIISVALYAHESTEIIKEINDSVQIILIGSLTTTFILFLIGRSIRQSFKSNRWWSEHLKFQHILLLVGGLLLCISMIPGIAFSCKCGHYFPNPFTWFVGGLLTLFILMRLTVFETRKKEKQEN